MIREHWFWWLLTTAVMVWYSTITVYVTIKGTLDIRHMLRRLKNRDETERHRTETDSSEGN